MSVNKNVVLVRNDVFISDKSYQSTQIPVQTYFKISRLITTF